MTEYFKIGIYNLQKGVDGFKKKLEKKRKQTFQRVLAGTPPSKEFRNIVFFFFFQGFYSVWGISRKLAWTTGKAVKVPWEMQ